MRENSRSSQYARLAAFCSTRNRSLQSGITQKWTFFCPADKFIFDALFTTITNANFDKHSIIEKIKKGLELKKDLSNQVTIEHAPDECTWYGDETEFEEKAQTVGVLRTSDEDIRSLKELVHYGIKGMAAYVEHAYNLGYENPEIFAFMQYAFG